MNKRQIYFTSDWHLGHIASLKFDARPFKDVNHMHETLIRNYNSVVPEDGVCYFLGDMGITKSDTVSKVVARLNGTKILLLGNHDKGMTAMFNMGFDAVLYGAVLYICKERVTMSHCPLLGTYRENTTLMERGNPLENWHGELRTTHNILSFKDEGQFHLHGHIHSRKGKPQSKKIEGKQYDIGVTANNYRPVSMSQIESWIAKYKLAKGIV